MKRIKKILMLLVTVLAVAMLTTPVLAAPAEKIELTVFGPLGPYSAPEYWISGNIIHGRGATCNAPTLISWDTVFPPTDTSKFLIGPSKWIADYNVNSVTGKGVLHYTVEIMLDGGTFKGTISLHGIFHISNSPPGSDAYYAVQDSGFRRGVLHGSGNYQGWKIVVTGETLPPELYIYKR